MKVNKKTVFFNVTPSLLNRRFLGDFGTYKSEPGYCRTTILHAINADIERERDMQPNNNV